MKKAYCSKHDTHYEESKEVKFGREITIPCPQCALDTLSISRPEVEQEQAEQQKENQANKSAGVFRNSGIPPRYTTRTIDNYKAVSTEQKKALASVKSYITNIDKVNELGTSMIMTGGAGTGKTHLASAIGNVFVSSGKAVAFMTVSAMLRKVRETYRKDSKKTEQQVINDLRKVDLLVLDEIGVQKGSESEEYLLFEVLNERYCHYKPTILISNLTTKEMTEYIGTRSLDRLREGGGRMVVFDWESYRSQVIDDGDLPTKSGSKY